MKEAAIRHAPLTVLTVLQAVRDNLGLIANYADDPELIEKARLAAQAETDKVLATLGESRPESVTVRAIKGFPAEELIEASKDADLVVVGERGAGGFARLVMGSVTIQGRPARALPGRHHPDGEPRLTSPL